MSNYWDPPMVTPSETVQNQPQVLLELLWAESVNHPEKGMLRPIFESHSMEYIQGIAEKWCKALTEYGPVIVPIYPIGFGHLIDVKHNRGKPGSWHPIETKEGAPYSALFTGRNASGETSGLIIREKVSQAPLTTFYALTWQKNIKTAADENTDFIAYSLDRDKLRDKAFEVAAVAITRPAEDLDWDWEQFRMYLHLNWIRDADGIWAAATGYNATGDMLSGFVITEEELI